MSSCNDVDNFINNRQNEISVKFDDMSTQSKMMQQAYMVGVLSSTLTTVLDFIEVRYGKEVAHEAKQRALIVK